MITVIGEVVRTILKNGRALHNTEALETCAMLFLKLYSNEQINHSAFLYVTVSWILQFFSLEFCFMFVKYVDEF